MRDRSDGTHFRRVIAWEGNEKIDNMQEDTEYEIFDTVLTNGDSRAAELAFTTNGVGFHKRS